METVKQSHWALEYVLGLAAAGNLWIMVKRATAFFATPREAQKAVKDVLRQLTIGAFAETQQLSVDVADVYGCVVDGEGWYLKITVDTAVPELVVISFHPLERPLLTNNGWVQP